MTADTASPSRPLRWLRRLAWAAAFLLTLFVLFHAIENFRGARALQRAIAEVETAGGTLETRALCPDAIPEAENYLAIPLLRDIARTGEDGDAARARFEPLNGLLRRDGADRPSISEVNGTPIDLAAWQAWLEDRAPLPEASTHPARAILAALALHDEAFFTPLAAGLDRRGARFLPSLRDRLDDLGDDTPFALAFPQTRVSMDLARVCHLRASAAAHAGDPVIFRETLAVMQRLIDAHRADPLLIGLLVSVAEGELLASAAWDALRLRILDEAALGELQAWLARQDPLEALGHCLQAEMAMTVSTAAWFKEAGSTRQLAEISGIGPTPPAWRILPTILPSGWWDQNAAVLIRRMQRDAIAPLRAGDRDAVMAGAGRVEEDLGSASSLHPYLLLIRLVLPAFGGIADRVGEAQARLHQAVLACALERYFLIHGAYPESLEALVPGQLGRIPVDYLSGRPPAYEAGFHGRYRLEVAGGAPDEDGEESGAWFYPPGDPGA